MKPFAESCLQNRDAIFQAIQPMLKGRTRLLEIGSGTAQHAVYFTPSLPDLEWQTSELAEHHAGIQAWLDEAMQRRILPPLELDVCNAQHWRKLPGRYDAVYSANTLHIISEAQARCLFSNVAKAMEPAALLIVYGPFNQDGQYTSASNARFDQWLKTRDANSGIKDFAWLNQLAMAAGLEHHADLPMPANNRILVWKKQHPPA